MQQPEQHPERPTPPTTPGANAQQPGQSGPSVPPKPSGEQPGASAQQPSGASPTPGAQGAPAGPRPAPSAPGAPRAGAGSGSPAPSSAPAKKPAAGSGAPQRPLAVEVQIVGEDGVPTTRSGEPIGAQASASPRHKLEGWLAEMVRLRASDLILRAGGRPSCRIDGRIRFLPGRVPNAGPLLEVLEGVCGVERMSSFKETGSVDTALHLDGLGRFRLNAYKQMGEPAVVLRHVAGKPPMLSTLHLPTLQLERLSVRKRGIILVTGIAGSGKSTALAAMIEYMNTHAERHIITLEDPVEMLFTEERCVISQREVGTDVPDFASGLRHSLRQSPDVILIGEMRDKATVDAALDATETGHLVMSTLHTVNAPQTLDRIVSFFPSEAHKQVRQRLAENLAAVMSMRLLPRKGGQGMVPATELLLSTPRVRELLYEGEVAELSRVVESGAEEGLVSFNHSLRTLVEANQIELEVALAASDRPEELLLALRGFSRGKAGLMANTPAGKLRLAGGE